MGYAGSCIREVKSLSNAKWLSHTDKAKKVDYLHGHFLLLDRSVLFKAVFGSPRRSQSNLDFDISHSLQQEGMSLELVPHVGNYQLAKPLWTREDFFRFIGISG